MVNQILIFAVAGVAVFAAGYLARFVQTRCVFWRRKEHTEGIIARVIRAKIDFEKTHPYEQPKAIRMRPAQLQQLILWTEAWLNTGLDRERIPVYEAYKTGDILGLAILEDDSVNTIQVVSAQEMKTDEIKRVIDYQANHRPALR